MVELFTRAPDGLQPAKGSPQTPIPIEEAVSSLSAMLLDEVSTHSSCLRCLESLICLDLQHVPYH